jgi:hypothetical protein
MEMYVTIQKNYFYDKGSIPLTITDLVKSNYTRPRKRLGYVFFQFGIDFILR